jgi:hypothetical protein
MKLVCEQEQLGSALSDKVFFFGGGGPSAISHVPSLSELLIPSAPSSHTCTLIYNIILIDHFECLRNLDLYSLDVLLHLQLFRNLPLSRKLNISEVNR